MPDYKFIAWTDIETTGLDPKKDHLLEVAIVLTDLDLLTIAQRVWLVEPPSLDIMAVDPFVRNLHSENGLFRDLFDAQEARDAERKDCNYSLYDGTPLSGPRFGDARFVDDQIISWLRNQLRPEGGNLTGLLAIGGSGVSHFESRWLPQYLPAFAASVHRSTVDVGVLRRYIEFVVHRPKLVPAATRQLDHRAMDDVQKHLREARRYRDVLKRA